MEILKPLFGQNAAKVKSIFGAWSAYAQVAMAHNEKWTSTTQEYKDERARRAYWAGTLSPLSSTHPLTHLPSPQHLNHPHSTLSQACSYSRRRRI